MTLTLSTTRKKKRKKKKKLSRITFLLSLTTTTTTTTTEELLLFRFSFFPRNSKCRPRKLTERTARCSPSGARSESRSQVRAGREGEEEKKREEEEG